MARERASPTRVAKDASAYITIAGAAAKAKDVLARETRCKVRGTRKVRGKASGKYNVDPALKHHPWGGPQ